MEQETFYTEQTETECVSDIIEAKLREAASKRCRRIRIAAVVVIALAVVAGGLWLAANVEGGAPGSFFDSSAQSGQAPYKTDAELQAEANRVVEEGMFNISILSTIEFDDGKSPGTAYIENVPANRYAMKVAIVLDDTGETLYESGGLAPGSFIESIALTRDLKPGEYEATALFTAFKQDTLDEAGRAAARLKLVVRG